jgi:hypothetical protein
MTPLPCGKSIANPEFFRSCIGQRNCYGIGVYDFAYVRCNRAQDLPQVEARRDSGRQIQEQLKLVVLTLKFRFWAHDLPKAPPLVAKNLRSK